MESIAWNLVIPRSLLDEEGWNRLQKESVFDDVSAENDPENGYPLLRFSRRGRLLTDSSGYHLLMGEATQCFERL